MEVVKLKKGEKLYVVRYVPHSKRVRNKKLLMLKTSLITLAVCLAIITVTAFGARLIPRETYLKILNKEGTNIVAAEEEITAFIYPEPDADTRAKADRMREIRLEEHNSHIYTPSRSELDNVYVYDRNKVCYLTFDDGPSAVTEKILDILKQYKVKATFFVAGHMAKANPKMIKAIYDGGHTIGNHSFSHDYNSVYSSKEGFKNEVLRCKNTINEALGFEYDNLVFRFPGGFNSLTDEENKANYAAALEELGYKYTDWSCLTGDSNVTEATEEFLMDTLKYGIDNTKTGDIVVLMHDSITKEMTAKTLPKIIEYLYSCGFEFDVLKN